MDDLMRCIMIAALAVGAVTDYHNFCLKTESGQDCAYDSITQCEAAGRTIVDTCAQNSPTQNH
jgi:hypothetical protein